MSDIKLFRLSAKEAVELQSSTAPVEKSLQTQIEQNMEAFLGVTFLASEYATSVEHGGRMDSIGIDENGYPVIVEYKRSSSENVINQGLFYLDWLMDHKDAFRMLVMDRVGKDRVARIEWSNPRLICIAADFNKYDEHAVKQMNRNIELIRYRRYGSDLLMLELVNAVTARVSPGTPSNMVYKTVAQFLEQSEPALKLLFSQLRDFCMGLGEDVQEKELKNYFAYKRIKNFACIEVHPQKKKLLAFIKVDPDQLHLEKGFTRDVRNIGHYGTGNLEITIKTDQDLEKAMPLIARSYEAS